MHGGAAVRDGGAISPCTWSSCGGIQNTRKNDYSEQYSLIAVPFYAILISRFTEYCIIRHVRMLMVSTRASKEKEMAEKMESVFSVGKMRRYETGKNYALGKGN